SQRLIRPSFMAIIVFPSRLNLNGRDNELAPSVGMLLSSWRSKRPEETSHSFMLLPNIPVEAIKRPSGLNLIWVWGEEIRGCNTISGLFAGEVCCSDLVSAGAPDGLTPTPRSCLSGGCWGFCS